MKDIFTEIGKKKITTKLIKHLLSERINLNVTQWIIRYIAKRYLNKSWQKVTNKKYIPES